ncbi:Uncaracterized surface protein containing fasciclin (FAS1) repeats [Salegentibacter holothuriorum]|uniref:Uncaracterized surface protein containing fasciclin (FAS1) repeats n=1 Tax=Salegentibacter holothuriorum TaxID=241145 RepID=A0A1T5E9Q9_9FLAO|nr:fasciclin domain-containing protein [Salegentibacter holothuriorum]SKB80606.1 Uncaracterized surface protein containing fasciclin (FAS1) repeats [Salegentibacter holothuriorum]
MKNSSFFLTCILLLSVTILIGCKDNKTDEDDTPSADTETVDNVGSNKGQAFIEGDSENPNALRLAINSKDHTTLVAAVQAAGVENALVNVGPLTVFAPTNAAFNKLPEGTVEDLLKPENKSKLAYILKNHVAPSNYPIDMLEKNIRKGRTLYMASGENVEVSKEGEDILVGGAKIIGTVKVSNGWVHVIEDVILPKE